uniref:BTB domain-containing protein n=2 Tax=Caenorhabditis tropicalis TaxID=1561998 RepID=A0A1I7UAA0_9PELO
MSPNTGTLVTYSGIHYLTRLASSRPSQVSLLSTDERALICLKPVPAASKMAAEVLQNEPHCFIASSSIDRPFKLLVQKETFLIDAESMSRISPIFNVMCFGKDFEKMDLSREIVDEKSNDIDCFLRAVHDTSMINSSNFALVLRLSNKYQVDPVIEACQNFIIRQHLDVLRADEILTMLIAAFEHHCKKEVVQKLIKRLASEGNSVFTKLKISRYLPAQVYGSVISTSMNLNQVKEHEQMNGHVLKMERSKIRWRQSVCDECKSVAECANCEECKKTVCRNHVSKLKCSNDYGAKIAADLKKKIVDFEWQD